MIVTAAVVSVLAAGAGVAAWQIGHKGSAAHSAGGCIGDQPMRVVVAPSIAPAITSIVGKWQATRPDAEGTCVYVSVITKDSRAAEQEFLTDVNPTVWIPDSTVWSSRFVAESPPDRASDVIVGASVARSPLVIAASPTRAAAVVAPAKQGWAGALAGSTPAEVPDPITTAEGALVMLHLQTQLANSAADQEQLGNLSLQLSQRVLPNAAAGFATLKDFPTTAPAFVASEQEVIRANEGKSSPVAAAVYPAGATTGLDYPLVTFRRVPGLQYAAALSKFKSLLFAPSGVRALNAIHLRNAAAAPLPDGSAESGLGSNQVVPSRVATAASITTTLRRWVAVRAPNQYLAVIDVSGSMRDDSGNGQSKVLLAAQASTTAVTLMPDAWSVGLWIFSLKPTPATDWTQLVPLGSVRSNRSALLSAANTLPSRAEGDTALYSTALAAFNQVSSHYKPDNENSVVLMTDGANTDPANSSLPALIAALKAQFDSKRPVNINTIALGADADVNALKQISAATGGRTYIVRKAQDIRTVFVQVALRGS